MNNPDFYSKCNGIQSCGVKTILNEYIHHLNWDSGERVLDIGCGPGDTTCYVLEKALPKDVTIVGCDISKEMVSYANKTYANEHRSFKTVDYSKTDVCDILGKNFFDKIFSFYCLHWIPDQRQCIKNIYDVMKENGTALISLPVKHECFAFYDTYTRMPEWAPYMKDIHGISPYYNSEDPLKDFHEVLKTVPFKVIKCDIKELVFRYPSYQEALDMVISVNPYSDKMPEDVKKKFFEEMDKYLTKICQFESDGQVRSDYSVIVAILQKQSQS